MSLTMEHLKHAALIALTCVLVLALTLASTTALQRTATTKAVVVGTPVSLGEITVQAERAPLPSVAPEEVLWLARGIYSETKRPDEQELVAWVIRNRVETSYRGNTSYEEAVLDPWQFSAFNRNSPKRRYYSGLTADSQAPGFQRALRIAERVALADANDRPFSKTTRHFYSERSMVGRSKPAWAYNRRPVKLDRPIDADRFRFYANVS